jgi:dienelactone hydrolase
MRIALPRASKPCAGQPSSICWSFDYNDADTDAAADAIRRAAGTCFGEHPFGLIGFSNGGYLLSKLFRTCRLHEKVQHSTWLLTVGSSTYRGALEFEPARLSGCGSMTMIFGSKDAYNADTDDQYLHALQAKGADVRSVRFDGPHLVPEEPTKTIVGQLLRE